ncbi:MAG: TIM23 complex component [Claussenomyces sp. TS43310]|nr:MAG: TIM23 complex component [Claussenomyces sp. TS43310]
MLRTETGLRKAAMSCRLQPTVSTPCTYHTATASRTQDQPTKRPQPLSKTQLPATPAQYTSRMSSSFPSASAASESSPNTSPTPPPVQRLDWNTFFKLRKTRRRIQLGSSIGTSLFGMMGGAQAIAMSNVDSIVNQVPLDPFITLGLLTFSCGGLGWLLGPIVGTGVFNLTNSKYRGEMIVKEKGFYDRVKRYRVDPSASSMANPVPDYYGEKISSVSDYRQWLKDQRAFNKKRQTFLK